jgi:NADH:ubiquinone oxidoreductase subunit 2 (subunit N)
VLNSALAAAYYLRVIAAVLLFESDEPAEPAPREAPMIGALLCGFLLIVFAFYPRPLMRLGRVATDRLRKPPAAAQTESDDAPNVASLLPFGEHPAR